MLLVVAPAVAAPTTQQTPPAAVRYRMVEIGTLGGNSSEATAINDAGVVVGRAQVADGTWHGFLWRYGRPVDLGLFTPRQINNRGQVVGTRDDTGAAVLWSRGRLIPLEGFSYPTGINDRGQVVGQLSVDDQAGRAGLWTRGQVRALRLNSASGINARGQVSGGRLVEDGFHASLWRRGRVTDLGAAAFNRSNTVGINDDGWVIGWTFSAQQYLRGTLWRQGWRTDLGTLGGPETTALAINDRGAILVTSQTSDGSVHPALWRAGRLTDLAPAGFDVDGGVADLNDGGEIVGFSRPVWGTVHAVVYRPQPATQPVR
jgi:probable HAF family extracellular repeat protein